MINGEELVLFIYGWRNKKKGCDIDWITYSTTSTATSLQFGALEAVIGWSD